MNFESFSNLIYTLENNQLIQLIGWVFIITLCVTCFFLLLNRWLTPIIDLVRSTNELKRLDQETAHLVHKSGFITKSAFRIFCKGAERYF